MFDLKIQIDGNKEAAEQKPVESREGQREQTATSGMRISDGGVHSYPAAEFPAVVSTSTKVGDGLQSSNRGEDNKQKDEGEEVVFD